MVIIILTNKEKEIVKDLYDNKKFSVKQILIVLDNPNITKSSVSSSKKDVESFYHYIYDDATIFLKRKKERFEKLDFI